MNSNSNPFLLALLVLAFPLAALAQSGDSFSLEEAVQFSLDNNLQVKNSEQDLESAKGNIREVTAIGLPQVNGAIGIVNNMKIQKQFIPAAFFDENAPPGEFVPVEFTPAWIGDASVSVNQLIFDGTYFLGLKAAKVYSDLARKTIEESRINAASQTTKAYVAVILNKEVLSVIEENLATIDSLLYQTGQMYENGFSEQIDVQRIEITRNDLAAQRATTERALDLSYKILNYQMGRSIDAPITLTESLDDLIEQYSSAPAGGFNYADRIEYDILKTQRQLDLMNIKQYRLAYAPRLAAGVNLGYNAAQSTFSDIARINSDTWFDYASLSIGLEIPIWDSFSKAGKIQQAKASLARTENTIADTERAITLEQETALVNLDNALDVLEASEKNIELSENIYRVTKTKFQEGVGSSLDVVDAETKYVTARNNYYSALMSLLNAQVDYRVASGTLINE